MVLAILTCTCNVLVPSGADIRDTTGTNVATSRRGCILDDEMLGDSAYAKVESNISRIY